MASTTQTQTKPTTTYYFKELWKTKYIKPAVNYLIKGCKITSAKDVWDTVRDAVKQQCDDIYIITRVMEKITSQRSDEWRIVDKMWGLTSLLKAKNNNDFIYLDYGCGNGRVTERVAKTLMLPSGSVYGVDIIQTCPADIIYTKTEQLPDNSIDLITAFVSIHHIKNIKHALSEIYRLLKPDGLFIIREHDYNHSENMYNYLQLIHVIASVKNSDAMDHCVHYYSYDELKELICASKFTFVDKTTYDGNNPQALYHAMFKKRNII